MPRAIRKTLTAAGSTAPIPLDLYPYTTISVAVTLSSGASLTYTVEHTYDDVFSESFNPATATWFPNTDLTNDTANGETSYLSPITGVRLRVSAYTSGSATINILQAGIMS